MSKQSKSDQNYPLEFPSRNGKPENSPIIDKVVLRETMGKSSGFQSGAYPDSITEVVTTETKADTEEQTTL